MKLIVLIAFLLSMKNSKAQLCDTVKYYITKAKINKMDCSESFVNNGQYLSFYCIGNDISGMLNSQANQKVYSYGTICDISVFKKKFRNSTITRYSFFWYFLNSYDNVTGKAKVTLNKKYSRYGVAFDIAINTGKNEDLIEFSGYTNEKGDVLPELNWESEYDLCVK